MGTMLHICRKCSWWLGT